MLEMEWASMPSLRNGRGGKGEQAGCRWTLPAAAPRGAGDSVLDLEKNTCAWGQTLPSPQLPHLENKEVGLGKSFSLCGPQISSISSAWELVRHAESQASLNLANQKLCGWGPAIRV